MNTENLSILITTILILSGFSSLSNAEEKIVLCLNPVDQYVVTVNEKEDCLEEEKPSTFTGRKMAELKGLTPVAVFENNESCSTEGTITKLGFDKNDNDKLDEDEVQFVDKTCAIPVDEESGG